MTININQVITNILNEDRTIKSTKTIETYLLTPAPGAVIKNMKTGEIFSSMISIGSRAKLSNFKELYPNKQDN